MTHIVITALVVAKVDDGSNVYLYRGAPVPSNVSEAEVKRLLDGEFIEKVADAEPEFPEGEPNESWKVPQLRAYAVAKEIDLGSLTAKPEILAAVSTK